MLVYKWAASTLTRRSRNTGSSTSASGTQQVQNDRWVFGDPRRGAYLTKFAWTDIVRHTWVISRASPDDPALTDYGPRGARRSCSHWASTRCACSPNDDPGAPEQGLAVKPGVERGTRDLKDLAQPLHPVGVLVVSDEPEATHQFVSPAKYLAARRRISRSVTSLVLGLELGLLRLQRRYPRPQRGQLILRRQPGAPVHPSGRGATPRRMGSAPAVPAVAVWARTHSSRVSRVSQFR